MKEIILGLSMLTAVLVILISVLMRDRNRQKIALKNLKDEESYWKRQSEIWQESCNCLQESHEKEIKSIELENDRLSEVEDTISELKSQLRFSERQASDWQRRSSSKILITTLKAMVDSFGYYDLELTDEDGMRAINDAKNLLNEIE